MKVREALADWLEIKKKGWCAKVTQHVEHLIEGWVRSFGVWELAELGVRHVEEHETRRDNGHRSASALNQERTYLRMFLKWARAHGWLTADPTATWRFRKYVVQREYAPMTREEEERFVKTAPPWLVRYAILSICTGLREGTLRQLTWAMVTPTWVLEIPGRLMKQKKPHRQPLPARAVEALGPRGSGLLFPGLPEEAALYQVFKKWGKKAGINPLTSPHDLRRTWVERLTAAGVPLQKIMRMGGWKSMGVILTHYYAAVPDQEALEAVEHV